MLFTIEKSKYAYGLTDGYEAFGRTEIFGYWDGEDEY